MQGSRNPGPAPGGQHAFLHGRCGAEPIEAKRDAKAAAKAARGAVTDAVAEADPALAVAALARSRSRNVLPDRSEILKRLEQARQLALVMNEPRPAVNTATVQAKVLGFVVEKQTVAARTPVDLGRTRRSADEERRTFQCLSEKMGSGAVGRFLCKGSVQGRGNGDCDVDDIDDDVPLIREPAEGLGQVPRGPGRPRRR